jgi:hypothetical protein
MSDFEVELVNDSVREFQVTFHGPDESEWLSISGETEGSDG